MSRASEFREAVEFACDDAHLTVIEIGSILIDLGHKYLGYASCDTQPKAGNSTEIEVPLVSGAVTNEVRQTPKA